MHRHSFGRSPAGRIVTALLLVALAAAGLRAERLPDTLSVLQFGAQGDGKTDDTVAFQKALDAAGAAGGGTVKVPRGVYFFAGHLNVPPAVTLKGIWHSVPAHNGIRDRGLPKPTDDGTTLLITEGSGSETGPAFVTLNTNSTLTGVVLYYPKQNPNRVPQPYPWAIAMRGKNPAVLDVEMLNPYNGIDATHNERHLIRNVHGQPLRRGISVDAIFDIGRIENVHFNPWWSTRPKLLDWQIAHGEAFIFGRSDWEYVLNTFCFGYQIGYRFTQTGSGVCNGNFLGLGADACCTCVRVDQSAPYGLLITNGQFVAFHGPDPTMIVVDEANKGSVRFVNCAFWGPCRQIAKIAGRGTVGFSDCTFVQWDSQREGRHAIQAVGGTLLVRGCEFRQDRPDIALGPQVRRAVVTGNVVRGQLRIANRSQGDVQIANNAADPPRGTKPGTAASAAASEAPPSRDPRIVALLKKGFPLVDYHVHLKGGLTIDEVLEHTRTTGIKCGVAPNCGRGFPITDDAGIDAFVEQLKGKPVLLGMQAEGREWVRMFSKEAIAKFDYVFTDAMTFTDQRGQRVRLWMDDEVKIDDKQQFMEMYVDRIVAVLNDEPIDIFVNPTFLPTVIADQYDTLWTKPRMAKVIHAAVKNGVAIEINARYRIPSATFITMAKKAGVRFAFGTNNTDRNLGRLEYCLDMVTQCGLTADDMFVPPLERGK